MYGLVGWLVLVGNNLYDVFCIGHLVGFLDVMICTAQMSFV